MENFPTDYNGVIGIPITGLKYLHSDGYLHIEIDGNDTQFEIVGCADADIVPTDWKGMSAEFIKTYYAISPTFVKWFGNTAWFKKMWKGTLDRMVNNLNKQGVENTRYEDKIW